MQWKWLMVVNALVLVIVILVLVVMLWTFSFRDIVVETEECVDVNKVSSFSYDSCYDAYSKTIFLEIKRGVDDYNINFLKVSFFDFEAQSYELTDVPVVGGARAYKIFAGKNPQNLDIVFDIVKDFSAPICEGAKRIFVRYCPTRTSGDEFNVSINLLGEVSIEDYIEVDSDVPSDSDVLDLSLVDKERIWESRCKSNWRCEDWESCVDGVQKRECRDINECFVPTSVPAGMRYCDGTCVENWECEWSECSGGYTVPKCKDLNSCGTSYDIPQKLECDFGDECIPNIECGEWTSCKVDYNFVDLIGSGINSLEGVKSRICKDRNSCVDLKEEVRSCSVNVDIYTKKFTRCGVEFIGVYDRLNNDLVAQIEGGDEGDMFLNIRFDDRGIDAYCDYCFDGIMDGDETGVDCGGSCEACEDKYVVGDFVIKSWWEKFWDWIDGLF